MAEADAAMAALLAEEEREQQASNAAKSKKAKKKAKKKQGRAEAAASIENHDLQRLQTATTTSPADAGAALDIDDHVDAQEATDPLAQAADEPPDDFVCPITQELMLDPVVAPDGHTYERKAIERWLETKATSPKSGNALESTALVPNHLVRRFIREWQEQHKRGR